MTPQEEKQIMVGFWFFSMALLTFLANGLEIFFCLWACGTVWGENAGGIPFSGLSTVSAGDKIIMPILFSDTTVHLTAIVLSVLILESIMTAVLTARINLEGNCNACTFCSSAGSSSVWLPSLLLVFYMNICNSVPVFHTIEEPGGLQFKNAIVFQAVLLQRHLLKYLNSVMVSYTRTKFHLIGPQISNQFIQCGIKRGQ